MNGSQKGGTVGNPYFKDKSNIKIDFLPYFPIDPNTRLYSRSQ